MLKFLSKFKYFDQPLQLSAAVLALAGLALLYSTAVAGQDISLFYRQLLFFAAGLFCYFFFAFFDYHALAKGSRAVYVVFVLMLIYLLVFGSQIRGGRRWVTLGFFNFQTAEFMKIVVILGLARLMYLRRGAMNSWRSIVWSLLYVLLPVALIALEPDFGSAAVLVAIWAGIILMSPVKKKFLAALLLVFVIGSGLAWKFVLKDFQKARVEVFLNPSLDPQGRGYNVRQATIAIGSGQLAGLGFGKGLQSGSKFLPEQQTDFAFAAAGEQIGFLGMAALLALYLFLLMRLVMIIRVARDDLGMYITGGVFFLFFAHIVINIGMNLGLLPVTGIPLPFLSAGGSSLIVALIALGIAQNVTLQSKVLRF